MLLDDTRDGPLTATAMSMRMLVATQGKQFTLGELDELLKECGFGEVSVTSTSSYFSLVSATKP
jgi:acetylserotonin N-methyltransferase